ncbi:right-handed parallel beta-helix repeat-containing protein [Rubinisphaera italica]|uniref:Right handed beta helix domain-containing protein n=1 Tax=Rubinisphaera italica TaxID=2527969 RepID=A0A5C5XBR4_9PLAN|nr:right-handed parallel beta-helix repeat-containing protein [Rubinisphaera italica]TWT60450.1 hypothetical protein Pan54_11640 [Rubinisphaera italica]
MKAFVFLSCLVFPGFLSFTFAEQNLYVSADANAESDGSPEQPFKTLNQARDKIRQLRKEGILKQGEGVTVHVNPGVYSQQSSFELTAQDSGTENGPIVYQAAKGGKVLIQGGISLNAESFQQITDEAVLSRLDPAVRNKVKVCDLSKIISSAFPEFKTAYRGSPSAPWLYVDQQPMTLSRWPNISGETDSSWAEFSKTIDTGLPRPDSDAPALKKLHPGSFVFEDSRPARWNLEEGVWLHGYWTHDWNDEAIRIDSYDKEKKIIKLAAPHSYGINAGTWGAKKRRFFALNTLEELDAPNEWYLDRNHKRLYFYPENELATSEIVLATSTQSLVKVEGTKHVKLIGMDFQYAHANGMLIRNTDHFEVIGCIVANLAGSGISFHGTSGAIRSCDVFNIGRGGISLNGGDRQSLTPAKNVAENNHIHHYGLFQRTYAPGIGVHGCGQIVRNNSIHDAPHNAVLYSGNEHLFEFNDVYRVVMETGDAGAFYTGRDWTSRGNILRHNFIHDLGGGDASHVNTMGIYLDDCDSGDTLEGNIFYRAGRALMIGGGRDNPVLNNLVVDCPIGLHIDARGMTWKQWNNPDHPSWMLEEKAERLNYKQAPWSTRYPRLAAIMNENPREPLGNPIRNNAFINCSKQVCSFDGNVKKLLDKFEIVDNLAVSTNGEAQVSEVKGFTDISGSKEKPIELGDDSLTARESLTLMQAWIQIQIPTFETIPIENIGLYKDEYRNTLPTQ